MNQKAIAGPTQEPTDSKYLPEQLRERYREMLADPTLTHLRKQIAMLDVRYSLLLENLDHQILSEEQIAEGLREQFPDLKPATVARLAHHIRSFLPESFVDHRTFKRLAALVESYKGHFAEKRVIQADKTLKQLFDMILDGRREGDVWEQIEDLFDRRRRLVEAEEKRLNQTQQSMDISRVVMMLGVTIQALREAVQRYVPDSEIQEYILQDADRIYAERLGGGGDPETDTVPMDRDDLRRSLSSVR